MPIVFEEVTGEIAPEREPREPEPTGSPAAAGDSSDNVRRVIALMLERDRRLHAD
jgi:hypothetical protein